MSLTFNTIEYMDVFTREFSPFTRNNQIDFPTKSEEIAVIYGPNGTGKTSLTKVLADRPKTKLEYTYNGKQYTSGASVFHIISDQNNRNIISGEMKEFFLGDNIQREFELEDLIAKKRNKFLEDVISSMKAYKITAANSPLVNLIKNTTLKDFIKDCVNMKSKGNRYEIGQIVELMKDINLCDIVEYEEEKVNFIISDYGSEESIICQIEEIADEVLLPNHHVREIEENTEAISILNRFHKNQCIVCDNQNIDWNALLEAKKANREEVKKKLEPKVIQILEKITSSSFDNDPFNLKQRLLQTIENGETDDIDEILTEIDDYRSIYSMLLQNAIVTIYTSLDIDEEYREYQELIDATPEITDEDCWFINEIVNNSMGKDLLVERDNNNRRLRIRLSNQELLGVSREDLPLSTGEQNFLSLTFEFLKAKNSASPIVVIDDPVSSFDSIYKNKVVYSIVKILHNKKRIILTHNIDLIRLLGSQYKRCFKLYLLNNTDGELNGFIPINDNEQNMLIDLKILLEAFRTMIPKHVHNYELYLISMIPFMRGYARIMNNTTIFEELTQVMHGYKTKKVDIARIYRDLFENKENVIPDTYSVNVSDILLKKIDGISIVDENEFPLLNRTLVHSFQYLYLRLEVEKALVEKFNIDTNSNKQLGDIISAAFPDNNIAQIHNRMKLMSMKTLINEFNHFEGNLSIFQPAIDITDQALSVERDFLKNFIDSL